MKLTELQQTYRKNIVEHLRLLSSSQEQLEYQRQVPIADVSAELFCMWGDDYYNEELRDDAEFRCAFSSSELAAMEKFNQVFDDVLASLPDSHLPWIDDFILTPEWKKLSNAAAIALLAFKAKSG